MPTLILSKPDELYLSKCADEHKFAYGLIIGQWVEAEKCIAAHLAKNSEEDLDSPDYVGPQSIADITSQFLANQWLSACKMTPGSLDVVGIFITSATGKSLKKDETIKHAKTLFSDMHSILGAHHLLVDSGSFAPDKTDTPNTPDYLLLTYANDAKKAECMYFNHGTNEGKLTPMDCKIAEKPLEWLAISCNYELDDIFPIHSRNAKINIEEQYKNTTESVRNNLAASEIFLEHENVDNSLTLDAYVRRKNQSKRKMDKSQLVLHASIFLPVKCQVSNPQPIKVRQFNGTIRFAGVISSRIWCNGQTTLGDVKKYIRKDILRSLSARIQIYCDALTDPLVNQQSEFISEPPRRVYFNLPTEADDDDEVGVDDVEGDGNIQFSEYIFRGEAPNVAVAQAKQVLDVDLNPLAIEANVESLNDEDELAEKSQDQTDNADKIVLETPSFLTRNIFTIGIVVAVFVVIMSIFLQSLIK